MEVKYNPGRSYIEIDGIRLTAAGYRGGASVTSERNAQEKREKVLQLCADAPALARDYAILAAEAERLRKCVELYANHDNWGCTTMCRLDHDCESQPEQCCLDEWSGPVGVHGYEEAERVIRERQAKNKGGDAT